MKNQKKYLVYRIAEANGKRISEDLIGALEASDGAAAKQGAEALFPFRPCETLFVRQAKSKKDRSAAEALMAEFCRKEAEMRAIMEKT